NRRPLSEEVNLNSAPRKFRRFVPLLLLLAASPALGQKKKMTLEDVTAEPPLSGRLVRGVTWLPGSDSFSFVLQKGAGEEIAGDLVLEDANTGARRTIATPENLALPDDPKRRASLEGYRWSPDGKTVVLSGDNDLWFYDVADKKLERITRDKEKEEFPQFSPDGRRLAFVRKNDLYVLDLASKTEKRLTTDGSEHVYNGRLDWVYEEELASRTGRSYEWSPDSAAIAYLRLDETKVDSYPLVDFLKVPAGLKEQRYPKAGSANSTPSFHVVGVDGTPRGSARPEGDVYIEPAFSWTPDSKSVCYRVLNRAQDSHDVRLLSAADGSTKSLFVEKDQYWINVYEPPRFLKDGRYVWKSDRDGFTHIYVGSVSGGEPRQITRGNWIVDRIAGVDENLKFVFFSANEENIRRRALYRVSLEGTRFLKLPLPPGTHQADLSSDGRYLLDTFSSTTQPPILTLIDGFGRPVRVVDRPENRLGDYELATSEE